MLFGLLGLELAFGVECVLAARRRGARALYPRALVPIFILPVAALVFLGNIGEMSHWVCVNVCMLANGPPTPECATYFHHIALARPVVLGGSLASLGGPLLAAPLLGGLGSRARSRALASG
jgi:hypothetical protein